MSSSSSSSFSSILFLNNKSLLLPGSRCAFRGFHAAGQLSSLCCGVRVCRLRHSAVELLVLAKSTVKLNCFCLLFWVLFGVLNYCHQIIRCFGFRPGFLRVNMRPSCVSHVQNVSPSPLRLTFDCKTRMFRRVFFNVFICFLGVCFWGCCAYFPYLVGSVELFVVFFGFILKNIGCF